MGYNGATPDPTNWRDLYTAEKEHWNDIQRAGKVFLPVVLLIFLATIAAIAYNGIHASAWAANVTTRFQQFWFLLRIYIILFSPMFFAIGAIVLLYRAVLGFIRTFHAQYLEKSLLSRVQTKLVGVPPLPPPMNMLMKYPFVTIKEAGDLSKDHWVRWFGGPATLVVYDGTALYVERGNHFSRIIGPGKPPMPFLDRFETVKAVVDLRPQLKTGLIKPWTKDGLQVELQVRMECQINSSPNAVKDSSNLVYPFDPVAVMQAVEYTAVKRNPETKALFESDWIDGVWGQVSGYLARHISRHSADELALTELKDIGPSDGNLHTFELAKEHLDEINQDLANRKVGAHATNIHLVLRFVDEEVEKKRLEYWKSERDRLSIIRDSIAEAASIRIQQEARANAERDVLDAITERLKRVGPENLTEPLLLSLAGILDNSLDDPLIRPFIAKNSLDLLEKLKKILKERF